MRKIVITKEQYQHIMEESYPLNQMDKTTSPVDASGYEVFANNMDKDADPDATTTDAKSQKMSTRRLAYLRTCRTLGESTFNDERTMNFGKKQKEEIIAAGETDNSGKMLKNIAKEVQNGGSRDNTQRVRAYRLHMQKLTDPVTFEKNGGDEMLNAIESGNKKQSEIHAANTDVDSKIAPVIPDASNGPFVKDKGHRDNSIIYYH